MVLVVEAGCVGTREPCVSKPVLLQRGSEDREEIYNFI